MPMVTFPLRSSTTKRSVHEASQITSTKQIDAWVEREMRKCGGESVVSITAPTRNGRLS